MAQNRISLNLSAADFTLSYRFKGPSVIIPGQDQNAANAQAWFTGDSVQRGVNIPQLAYCENTVPTQEGYRSVAYRYFIEPPTTSERFVKILQVFDGNANSAILGVTADRKIFIVSAYTAGRWVPVVLPAGIHWDKFEGITTAVVIGFIVVHIKGVGLFTLDVPAGVLSDQNPYVGGIDPLLINGVCASKGYLIAYDNRTIYWSSTENPLDFTPSLITGAGSGKPEGAKGKIVLCKEISQGFIIYCGVNIISAAYSNNKGIPWIFAVLSAGSGIRHEDAVAYDLNMTNHFAWTSAGLLGIELHRASPILPQVTDFIASGLIDSTVGYDTSPTTTFSDVDKEVRIAMIANRYVCISFGYLGEKVDNERQIPELKQSFIWDTQLKRWGKLNIDHIQIFEAPFTASPPVFF